ncbi:solute carrier family 2, facilitated glucose transporter member 12 isoform X1 [Stomoxys calcitrans]|uniref:solute carrier family 2, facilitated glucose transporter member 12 isoform X1 n=2 Tax=Stomoxys calcitrans TaxID=35570 RepID=UPI0027E315EB|nr:solute carrier family 2, facilitated glucose transporter member 12 isoform X1 [Stomoxys calcitrans]
MAQSSNINMPNVIEITENPSKPQTISTSAGGMIFLSAGMNMALGLGWYQFSLFGTPYHFCFSWFIGVMIGTIVTAILVNFIPKKFIMALSTLMILIGGILFTSVPQSYDCLLIGRYFNGIAIGLTIIPYLMNASEISTSSNRGICLALEQYCITFGIMIQMIYASLWSYTLDFPISRLHGIIDIFFALLAAGFLFLFVESPIDYMRKGEEQMALETLGRLRQPRGINREVQFQFEENKAYVCDQESMSMEQAFRQGLVPLVKMIFFRSMMLAFCYSVPLNAALQYSTFINSSSWAPSVVGVVRVLGAILSICLVDNIGRKLPSIFSAIIVGGLMIGIASLMRDVSGSLISSGMNSVMILSIVLQLFAGFFTPYGSVYMGEAFPLRVKPFLMAVVVLLEQMLHIIFINTFLWADLGVSLMTQGIMIVAIFMLLLLLMPETRKTSLNEAQLRFRNLFNTKLIIEV